MTALADRLVIATAKAMQGPAYGKVTERKARLAVAAVLRELSRNAFALRPEGTDSLVTAAEVNKRLAFLADVVEANGKR